jgi:hypothetical protein
MRALGWLLMIGVCFVSGGATCARREVAISLPPPPPVLGNSPGLAEVTAAVNRTAVIRELSTNTASVDMISMPALPKLSTTISLRKERDFRLRANLPIVMGSGLDMGSNADLFWFEVPDGIGMGRTLYYAQHDQYRNQLQRAVLPVDPTWVIDAMGLVQINPGQVIQGPVRRPDGKLELRSSLPMPAGIFERVCYVDPRAGHVTDQYLFSPTGVRIAESHASNHQFYVEQQCALPHTVLLTLTPSSGAPIEMQIDVGTYAVNQILSGDPNLFVIPQGASNVVDLTTLSPNAPGMIVPTSYQAPPEYQSNEIGPLPYRGLVR